MPPLAPPSPDSPASATAPTSEERRYWRSLDRLLDSPAVREQLQAADPEFPAAADLPPDAVSRRTMMTLMGASFALAGLAGCRRPIEKIVPYVDAPEQVIPGIPRYFATTLPLATNAYGVLVESHEGRPTKIEGNPQHPSSQGAASAWMQAAILDLYDPDRAQRITAHSAAADAEQPTVEEKTWDDFKTFWQERAAELEATGGEGLAIVSEAYASPTMARSRAAFADRYPQAHWVTYEPLGDEHVFAGMRLATGQSYRPLYNLRGARKILALDADFLHAESDSLRLARDFAHGRAVDHQEGGINRLYAVESTLTLTGAAADHRLRLASHLVDAFARALAAELGLGSGAGGAALPADVAAKVKTIAADLAASPGEAVVIVGQRQAPQTHALGLAINQALGAIGQTLTLHELRDVGYGRLQDLADLVAEMNSDRITTLVMIGGNPAYNAPADVDFAAALARVAHTVSLSPVEDETARLASWHVPQAHFLEAWGDARAADGTASVIQPLIAPLFDSKSAIELVDFLTTGVDASGYDLVRETWAALLADASDRGWRRVLHDGVQADSALPPVPVTVAADIAAPALPGGSGLEVTFHASASTYDGRFANNGWLQEMPDVITKEVWGNAALFSTATASAEGLADGDEVTLSLGEHSLTATAMILPGQADGSVALALGYGRTAAGRIGDGVGVNAYALRSSASPSFATGLTVAKTGGQREIVQTQEHWSMEGRDLVRETSFAEYRGESHGSAHATAGHGDDHGEGEHAGDEGQHHGDFQLFPYFDYSEGPQWGLAIDLNACIGCNACIIACQSENNIPIVGPEQVARGREMHWLRIDRYFAGEPADPETVFQPIPCMHCENAPCEQVCPVAATVHDSEGLNAMVYNRCIGTRYCSNNCPYKVRRFNFFNYTKDTPELVKMAMNPDVTVRSRGVMEKCTYCVQRISEGKIHAKREERALRDGEIRTACQQTCPTDAIVFGDIRAADSEVAHRKALDRDYVLLEELNNRPRTSYQVKVRNPNPDWESA